MWSAPTRPTPWFSVFFLTDALSSAALSITISSAAALFSAKSSPFFVTASATAAPPASTLPTPSVAVSALAAVTALPTPTEPFALTPASPSATTNSAAALPATALSVATSSTSPSTPRASNLRAIDHCHTRGRDVGGRPAGRRRRANAGPRDESEGRKASDSAHRAHGRGRVSDTVHPRGRVYSPRLPTPRARRGPRSGRHDKAQRPRRVAGERAASATRAGTAQPEDRPVRKENFTSRGNKTAASGVAWGG